jgi:hypothetical protein
MIDANGRYRSFKVSCHAKVPIIIGTRGSEGVFEPTHYKCAGTGYRYQRQINYFKQMRLGSKFGFKVILTFFFVGFSLHSYCQFNIKIGTSAGVLFPYRELIIHDNSAVANQVKKSRNEEVPTWGYSFALNGMFIKNKWLIEAELLHTQTGYKSVITELIFGDPIGLPITTSKVESFELQNIYKSIRIPLSLGYTYSLTQHKNQQWLIPMIGVSNNILYEASTKGTIFYDNGTYKEQYSYKDLSDYKQFTISALCGLTYLYQINKFGFAAKCVGLYTLMPTISNTTLSEYEYWFAANIILSYQIK